MQRSWITDVDGVSAIQIPGAIRKTKRPQLVPVTPEVSAIVAELPIWNMGDYLLSGTGGAKPNSGFSKAKTAIDKIVGFSDWTFHDIRRTVATKLARRKVPQERIDRILGHAIGGVQGTYNLYQYFDEKHEALAMWATECSKK